MRAIRTMLMTSLLILSILGVGFVQAETIKSQAPNWKTKCADGSRLEFHEELAKGPVVVSFWATWCKPCLRELPHLDKLQKAYPEQLTVLAVNVDDTRSVNKVRPLIKSKRYGLRIPLDTSGDIRRLLQIGNSVPYLIVYDRDGTEVYRHMGYKDGDEKELEAIVAKLLKAEDS
jgi:cytochrome c biogenesis protein CcmG, thiol:disulfide interchange protein DsbE